MMIGVWCVLVGESLLFQSVELLVSRILYSVPAYHPSVGGKGFGKTLW